MGFSIRAVRPAATAVLASAVFMAAGISLQAQTAATAAPGSAPMTTTTVVKVAPSPYATYDNRWEAYGGLLFMNGQAGQDLPLRFNMGGAELMGTYWLGAKRVKTWGVAGDYRFGAGTSPVAPVGSLIGLNRVTIFEHTMTGGVVYRTPFRNRYAAIDVNALAGTTYGIFDHALRNNPEQGAQGIAACPNEDPAHLPTLGTYCNHFAPYGTVGASIDFNDTAKLAIRLKPDLIFEHFGTETREYFAISLGAMYRFGGAKKK
jgi:hypothetical protein